jgi:hypothetical protein
MPRELHRLWLDDKPPSSSEEFTTAAPPLSSYSSIRPGACVDGPDEIQQGIDQRLRQLKAIRTLGYEYLTPLGVGKTMQMIQDEDELRKQMEEQMQHDAPTAENLLGEAEQERVQLQQRVQDPVEPEPVTPAQQQQVQPSIQPETQPTEIDLDEEIPQAGEADYDQGYDEDEDVDEGNTFDRQYDRAFMVSEQYEAHDEEEEHEPIGAHFITPTRPEEVQLNRGIFHSGSTPIPTFPSESSFDAGNVSINGSDLDMTIDD